MPESVQELPLNAMLPERGFGFERGLRGLFEQKHRLISTERERGACSGFSAADFGTRAGFVAIKGMGSECVGRTHLGKSGVQFAYLAN